MVKKLILILACTVALNANLNVKIENLIGKAAYSTHQNLINFIFANQQAYYLANGEVNYTLVSQKLQDNNLLKLKFPSTEYINITFRFTGEPKKPLSILKDVLKSLGHYYYFTQEAKFENNNFVWRIKLKTEAAINPLKLSQALTLRNSKITDIIREGDYNYYYFLNTENSEIYRTNDLVLNQQLSLKKSSKPYMLEVANANAININSRPGNRWHPNVVFYDEKLNILEIYKEDSLQKSIRLDVPIDTRYIKIDDLYSLSNLRKGIRITKE